MAVKTKNNTRKRGGPLKLAVILFVCFLCYTIVKLQIGISQMRSHLNEIEQENEEISMQIEEQKITLDQGLTQEAVEQIARDTLNYVYPDEIIYTDLP